MIEFSLHSLPKSVKQWGWVMKKNVAEKSNNKVVKQWLHTADCVQPNKILAVTEWEQTSLVAQNEPDTLGAFSDPKVTINNSLVKAEKRRFRKDITLDDSLNKALFGEDFNAANAQQVQIKKYLISSRGNQIILELLWRAVRKSAIINTSEENKEGIKGRLLTVLLNEYMNYRITWIYDANNTAGLRAKIVLNVFLVEDAEGNHHLLMKPKNQNSTAASTSTSTSVPVSSNAVKHDKTKELPATEELALLLRIEATIAVGQVALEEAVSFSSSSSSSSFSSSSQQSAATRGLVVESLSIFSDIPNLNIVPGQAQKQLDQMVADNDRLLEQRIVEQHISEKINDSIQLQRNGFEQVEAKVNQIQYVNAQASMRNSSTNNSVTVTGNVYVVAFTGKLQADEKEGTLFAYAERGSRLSDPKLIISREKPSIEERTAISLLKYTATVSSNSELSAQSSTTATPTRSGLSKAKKSFKVSSIEMESNFPSLIAKEGQNTEAFKQAAREKQHREIEAAREAEQRRLEEETARTELEAYGTTPQNVDIDTLAAFNTQKAAAQQRLRSLQPVSSSTVPVVTLPVRASSTSAASSSARRSTLTLPPTVTSNANSNVARRSVSINDDNDGVLQRMELTDSSRSLGMAQRNPGCFDSITNFFRSSSRATTEQQPLMDGEDQTIVQANNPANNIVNAYELIWWGAPANGVPKSDIEESSDNEEAIPGVYDTNAQQHR